MTAPEEQPPRPLAGPDEAPPRPLAGDAAPARPLVRPESTPPRGLAGPDSKPPRPLALRLAPPLALLGAAALVRALAGALPDLVEAHFVHGWLPLVRRAQLALFASAPVSAGEALLVVAIVIVGAQAARGAARVLRGRSRPGKALARGLVEASWIAAVLYALFLGTWGLAYARPSLARLAGLEVAAVEAAELRALALELAARASALRESLPEDGAGVMRIDGGWLEVERSAAQAFDALAPELPFLPRLAAPLRVPRLSPLMTRAGISGIWWPFTGEAHVNGELPAPARPFTACHELAHARGVAAEDEASFVAWLACRASRDAALAYSGDLEALRHCIGALAWSDPSALPRIGAACSPGVLRDIEAESAFWRRHRSAFTELARSTNDLYLKAQGEVLGTRSYGRLVDLLLAHRRARR